MRTVREIFDGFSLRDETVIFQVKSRKALNKILDELEKVDDWIFWDVYRKERLKDVYLFVGNWRMGNIGIFPYKCIDYYGEYRFDDFLVDWKSPSPMILDQKIKFNQVMDIFDKYRKDLRISRKKYEEVSQERKIDGKKNGWEGQIDIMYDITFCANKDCKKVDCRRHSENTPKKGLLCFSMFNPDDKEKCDHYWKRQVEYGKIY